jgi:hypothetical protein
MSELPPKLAEIAGISKGVTKYKELVVRALLRVTTSICCPCNCKLVDLIKAQNIYGCLFCYCY